MSHKELLKPQKSHVLYYASQYRNKDSIQFGSLSSIKDPSFSTQSRTADFKVAFDVMKGNPLITALIHSYIRDFAGVVEMIFISGDIIFFGNLGSTTSKYPNILAILIKSQLF
jgi:hypothetical protein